MTQRSECTENLYLGRLKEKDKSRVVDILTNDLVKQTYMVPDFPSREAAEPLFYRFQALSEGRGRFFRGIYAENELVGFIHEVERIGQTVELGYVIHPDFHNRGYATRALQLAAETLFGEDSRDNAKDNGGEPAQGNWRDNDGEDIQEIITGAFAENKASIRVMEKNGMKRMDREEELEYRGKVHHCVYYSLERPKPWRGMHYSYFCNRECEYFPCHKTEDEENFNCLFCFCPLYSLGDQCGGNFVYLENGIKDCSNCMVPHKRENYGRILQKQTEHLQKDRKNI